MKDALHGRDYSDSVATFQATLFNSKFLVNGSLLGWSAGRLPLRKDVRTLLVFLWVIFSWIGPCCKENWDDVY